MCIQKLKLCLCILAEWAHLNPDSKLYMTTSSSNKIQLSRCFTQFRTLNYEEKKKKVKEKKKKRQGKTSMTSFFSDGFGIPLWPY